MSPEKQRIKIAEVRGWKEIRAEVDWLPKELTGIFTWPHPTDAEKIKYFINRKPIPDYLNDLNAMHEAEESIPQDLHARWMLQLCKLTKDSFWSTTRATAAQRAEAFLRTLSIWTEE